MWGWLKNPQQITWCKLLGQHRQNQSQGQRDLLFMHGCDNVHSLPREELMLWRRKLFLSRAPVLISWQSRQLKGHKKPKASSYLVITSDETVCSKVPSWLSWHAAVLNSLQRYGLWSQWKKNYFRFKMPE